MALWNEIMNNYMKQGLQIQQGQRQPWETPEHKGFEQFVTNWGQNEKSRLFQDLTGKGITGGAFTEALNALEEQKRTALLENIRGMYAQPELLNVAGNQQQLQLQKDKMQQDWDMLMAQLSEKRKGRHQEREAARMQGISSGINSAQSGGCCFIFLQGEGILTQSVRSYRDAHYGDDGLVAHGYKWMAKWLVPLMDKNPIIQHLVKYTMTTPLSLYAEWDCGMNNYGWVFAPFKVWVGIWGLIGYLAKE